VAKVNTEEISEGVQKKPQREPLSRKRIVRAALRIMDAEGLEAVTMRRIGRELGVEAMSLYNHVLDKDDILDSICEEVMAEFRIPQAEHWTEAARLGAHEYRRLLLAHPNVLTLMTGRKAPFTNPESMRAFEFALDLFRTAGFSPVDALMAFHAFGGYILGYVTMELGTMVGGPENEEHARAHREMARMVETEDLPRLRESLPYLADCDIDEQFEFGLDLLIEGIRARVADSR
jgi:AcrR family transcriptional regulator